MDIAVMIQIKMVSPTQKNNRKDKLVKVQSNIVSPTRKNNIKDKIVTCHDLVLVYRGRGFVISNNSNYND